MNKIAENIKLIYNHKLKQSSFYPSNINETKTERWSALLNQGTELTGDEVDVKQKFILPTIIDDVKPNFKIMQEEIFDSILPVLTFEDTDEPINYINKN